MALWRDRDHRNAAGRPIAQRHADALRRRLAELVGMIVVLDHLVATCAGDGRPDCPILDEAHRLEPLSARGDAA